MAAPAAQFEKASPDAFESLHQLGKGAFGKVFKVQHKATGEIYAMKTIQKTMLEGKNLTRYAHTELSVLACVDHPYIVSLRYAFQTEKQFVLVMTYCSGGTIRELLKKQRKLSAPLTTHYAAEVLLALCYLHEHKILYRDLKPENVLLDDDRHTKITDFGLSKDAFEGNLAKSFLGSIWYVAPEILARSGHNHTVDIYGLGVVVHNLVTGKPPLFDANRDKMWENIRNAPLVIPDYVPTTMALFIEQTMRRIPSERPGAERTADLQQHPFFAGLDFESMMRKEVQVPALPPPPLPAPPPMPTKPVPQRAGLCTRALQCWKSGAAEVCDFGGEGCAK